MKNLGSELPDKTRMFTFWLTLVAFPVVGAVIQTNQIRSVIVSHCDIIFATTSTTLCTNPVLVTACTNFFIMAEICRWTRCNYVTPYPDIDLLEVVESTDIASYKTLVKLCVARNDPFCHFARTMLILAKQCHSGKVFFYSYIFRFNARWTMWLWLCS